jgi:hypothetical protein
VSLVDLAKKLKPERTGCAVESIPATTGYHRPHTAHDHDVGLSVARQLADILTIHTDRAGTTVEPHFPLTGHPAH